MIRPIHNRLKARDPACGSACGEQGARKLRCTPLHSKQHARWLPAATRPHSTADGCRAAAGEARRAALQRWVAVLKELGTHSGGLGAAGAPTAACGDADWQNLHLSPFEGITDGTDGQLAIKVRRPAQSREIEQAAV